MRLLTKEQLDKILAEHLKWLQNEGGEQADLSFANLRSADLRSASLCFANLSYADLSYADLRSAALHSADLSSANLSYAALSYADLRYANLCFANLSFANLCFANLSFANLRSANLCFAKLDEIKKDFFEKLLIAKNEVVGLYDCLMRGKINGQVYVGDCACFVGTIANLRNEPYVKLTIELKPESLSSTEKWFLSIYKGDTPDNNPVSAITAEWMREFAKTNEISLPEYRLVSNLEYPEIFNQQKEK